MRDSDPRIRRSLRASIADGAFFQVMVGAGDTLVPPAAVFLGATNLQIASLTAVPQLGGALSQFLSVELTDRTGRRRLLILAGVALHAFMWIPILGSLFLPGPEKILVLVGAFTLALASLHLVNPPWMSVMGDLVEPSARGRYFGTRNLVSGIALIASVLSAGTVVHVLGREGHAILGFTVCFTAAFFARLGSLFFLSRMHVPPYRPAPADRFTLLDFIRRSPRSNFARFVFHAAAMNFAVAIAGPFFAPYQIRVIGLGYGEYAIAHACHLMGMYFSMHSWGTIGDVAGNRRVLVISSLGVAIVPFLWLFVSSLPTVIVVQIFSGMVWAGFSLSATNFIFDAVTPPKRARCSAYYTAFALGSVSLGSVLGGVLTFVLGPRIEIGSFSFAFRSQIEWILIVSGLLRLIACLVSLPLFREVRPVSPMGHGEMVLRVLLIKPFASILFDVSARRSSRRSAGKSDNS